MKILILYFLGCLPLISVSGQISKSGPPIIFIYDASGSMWGHLAGKTKMQIAAEVLTDAVNELPENQQIGLVAYGHRNKGDCRDVEFLVDYNEGTNPEFIAAVAAVKPLGMTPLAYAASLVIDRIRDSKTPATVILVTDGIESCDGNICEVVRKAREQGVDFRLHIIGFGLVDEDTGQLECAAKAGDGRYFPASDAADLGAVMHEATASTVDKPKNNASVFAFQNGKPIDALIEAYDIIGKRDPIRVRTYRDTAYFYLPPSTYNFEVRPLEGSDVKTVTVSGIKSREDDLVHQEIGFDGGKINIAITNNGNYWDAMVKAIDQDGAVAGAVRTYDAAKELELNPGLYTVTIQALDINGLDTFAEIENVSVTSGGTRPVKHDFQTGTAFIDARLADKSIDSIVTISESASGRQVAAGRTYDRGRSFLLNIGVYIVKITPLGPHNDRSPQLLTIEVTQGAEIVKTVIF
ncbi:Ca-activated chloride channel family protein [Cyclobacterium lianum]|uniref:Ca-activated chloride channel family protein n=1 Tax=Cyclobacterium lianum TaxID=388280 RepID=A0A1M7I7A5_9BACT|nr:VWA domain-containing protein [Cyclobacterium lianum]SHM36433.1 Ca-activated chloride channel family protein [Cyclobacterium lianum]